MGDTKIKLFFATQEINIMLENSKDIINSKVKSALISFFFLTRDRKIYMYIGI